MDIGDLTCPKYHYPTMKMSCPAPNCLAFIQAKSLRAKSSVNALINQLLGVWYTICPCLSCLGWKNMETHGKPLENHPKQYMKQKDPSMETFRMPGQIVGETAEFRRALVSLHLMCDLGQVGSWWVHKPVLWHLYGETGRAPPDFHDITPNWHRSWESLSPRVYPQGTTASASSCLGWCYKVRPS